MAAAGPRIKSITTLAGPAGPARRFAGKVFIDATYEGDIGVRPKRPYQIGYGSLVPKKVECVNLLVPVCLSASHIA